MSQVRGYGRVDLRVDEKGFPHVIEVNTLPGLTETSLLPKSASYDGMSFKDVIQKILSLASTDYANEI